ncbi:hypothetical protein [Roseomonas sp. AR75]|uniref:hypothetical protein n=1 Tax=Roseomonas sp. AR75 TaxID=2562311 RepID=UPI0010BFCA55|nr:hypothetical protein [Roseomonas sp. AR75]
MSGSDEWRRKAEALVRHRHPKLAGEAFEALVRTTAAKLRGAPLPEAAAGSASRRPDHSAEATAPYRFVPYAKGDWLPAQNSVVARDGDRPIDIINPLPDGLCARIHLCWTAETPLLIGKQDQGSQVVVPLYLGDDKTAFVIPAATLRGAIRAVAEIAADAKLSQVNRERLFGLRDFTHAAIRGGAPQQGGDSFPVSQPASVKAGWLRLNSACRASAAPVPTGRHPLKGGSLNTAFEIEPCDDWFVIEADDVLAASDIHWDWSALPRKRSASAADPPESVPRPETGRAFTMFDLATKYRLIRAASGGTVYPTRQRLRFRRDSSNSAVQKRVVLDPGGDIHGHLVFSGRSPEGKRYEYVLPAPKGTQPEPLTEATMRRFRQLNSRAVDENLEPESNWRTVLQAFARNREVRIPVFYVGDLATQPETGERAFFMGLTRLFKVPHRWSFDSVLSASGVEAQRGPYSAGNLDMVEALFGFVREPVEGMEGKTPPADVALKGRVAFSAALPERHAIPAVAPSISTVMVGPKPSFAPFYLAADGEGFRDYSAPTTPRIAGRKRYPPRHAGADPQDALPRIAARLQKQIANIQAMTRRPPEPHMLSHLSFLMPPPGGALRFNSEVRLFNVTPEELGLVLWALTFGGRQATHRHMVGRAKPFGAGQMRVEITGLTVERNASGPPEAALPEPFLADFERYVAARIGADGARLARRAKVLEALLATSDPAKGAAWDRAGKLDTMTVARRDGGETVQPFQRLRNMVKPDSDGRDPIRVEWFPLR